jgi:hypothetical protein
MWKKSSRKMSNSEELCFINQLYVIDFFLKNRQVNQKKKGGSINKVLINWIGLIIRKLKKNKE